jgi:hypothetical protein
MRRIIGRKASLLTKTTAQHEGERLSQSESEELSHAGAAQSPKVVFKSASDSIEPAGAFPGSTSPSPRPLPEAEGHKGADGARALQYRQAPLRTPMRLGPGCSSASMAG